MSRSGWCASASRERDPAAARQRQVTDQDPAVAAQTIRRAARPGCRRPNTDAEKARFSAGVRSSYRPRSAARTRRGAGPGRDGGPPNSRDLPGGRRAAARAASGSVWSCPPRSRPAGRPPRPAIQPEVHPVHRGEPAEPAAHRHALRQRAVVLHQRPSRADGAGAGSPPLRSRSPVRSPSSSRVRIATVTASCRSGWTGSPTCPRRPGLPPAPRPASGRPAARTAPGPSRPGGVAVTRGGRAWPRRSAPAYPRPAPGLPSRTSTWARAFRLVQVAGGRRPPRRRRRRRARSATTGRPG